MLLVVGSVELTIASAERACPIPSLNNPFETVTTHHNDAAALTTTIRFLVGQQLASNCLPN
jgi:hypothetical protein